MDDAVEGSEESIEWIEPDVDVGEALGNLIFADELAPIPEEVMKYLFDKGITKEHLEAVVGEKIDGEEEAKQAHPAKGLEVVEGNTAKPKVNWLAGEAFQKGHQHIFLGKKGQKWSNVFGGEEHKIEVEFVKKKKPDLPTAPPPTCKFFAPGRFIADDEMAVEPEGWPFDSLMSYHGCMEPSRNAAGITGCEMFEQQSSCTVYQPSPTIILAKRRQTKNERLGMPGEIREYIVRKSRFGNGTPMIQAVRIDVNAEGKAINIPRLVGNWVETEENTEEKILEHALRQVDADMEKMEDATVEVLPFENVVEEEPEIRSYLKVLTT